MCAPRNAATPARELRDCQGTTWDGAVTKPYNPTSPRRGGQGLVGDCLLVAGYDLTTNASSTTFVPAEDAFLVPVGWILMVCVPEVSPV